MCNTTKEFSLDWLHELKSDPTDADRERVKEELDIFLSKATTEEEIDSAIHAIDYATELRDGFEFDEDAPRYFESLLGSFCGPIDRVLGNKSLYKYLLYYEAIVSIWYDRADHFDCSNADDYKESLLRDLANLFCSNFDGPDESEIGVCWEKHGVMAADWYTAVWWWDDEIDTCSIEYLIIEQNADSEFPTDDDSERLPWDELDQEDKEKFKFPDVYQASHQPVDYWLAVYRKLLAEYEAQK